MTSTKRLMVKAMMLLCVPLAGCVHTSIQSNVPDCERLIPPSWRKGVPPADLPVPETLEDGHDSAKPWQKGFIEQTGQVEKANDRTRDTDYIYASCLAAHREQEKKAKRGFFARLFGG